MGAAGSLVGRGIYHLLPHIRYEIFAFDRYSAKIKVLVRRVEMDFYYD